MKVLIDLNLKKDGDLGGNGKTHLLSEYCLEKNENYNEDIITEDPLHEWMPMVCSGESSQQKPILVTSKILLNSSLLKIFKYVIFNSNCRIHNYSGTNTFDLPILSRSS